MSAGAGASTNRRPAWFVALATSLLLTLLVAGCSREDQPVPAPSAPPATPGPFDALVRRGLCAQAQTRCVALPSGSVAVVYRALEEGRRPLLLWEPGGPGLAPPVPGAAWTVLPTWTHRFDVAVVVERWVLEPVAEPCVAWLSHEQPAEVDGPPAGCDVARAQYPQQAYADIARALDAQAGPVVGIYATSFGVVRAETERAAIRHQPWMVVDSPAPVPGTAASRLFAARARAVEAAVVSTPACRGPRCATRTAELARFLDAPDTPDGPSRLDRAYAVLGLAHDPAGSSGWLRRFWRSGGRPSGDDLSSVEDAALAYTSRATPEEALPERVGYVFGMCAAYQGWAETTPPEDPLVAALDALHRPCRSTPGPTWTSVPEVTSAPTLLLVNTEDLVTPVSFQRPWATRLSARTTTMSYAVPGHGSAPDHLQERTRRWVDAQEGKAR